MSSACDARDPQCARRELGGRGPGLLPEDRSEDLLGRPGDAECAGTARRLLRTDEFAVRFVRVASAVGSRQGTGASHVRRQRRLQQLFQDAVRKACACRRREPERHPYLQYFYIDYELQREQLPRTPCTSTRTGAARSPTRGWGPDLQSNSIETTIPNLDGAANYVALETEGRGPLRGVHPRGTPLPRFLVGRGDDMIFIDDDTWPPSLHGTGMEDYFGHAWGMQRNAYLFNGTIVHEEDVPGSITAIGSTSPTRSASTSASRSPSSTGTESSVR